MLRTKPFLKWAGGKNQILNELTSRFPPKFNKYIEPFVGGGAVFFKTIQRYGLNEYYISDINKDLISGYCIIKDNINELIKIMDEINSSYLKLTQDEKKIFYYKIRDDFNNNKNYDIKKTAQMLFLNKTCFNGIFRVNSDGKFNVPFNNIETPVFDINNLIRVSNILNKNKVYINSFDFVQCERFVDENSFVYLDPPYHNTFTSYTDVDFTEKDQIRLFEFYRLLDKKGAKLMLSSSSTNFIENLYSEYNIIKIPARRFINSNGNGRGVVDEMIITNYERKQEMGYRQIHITNIL